MRSIFRKNHNWNLSVIFSIIKKRPCVKMFKSKALVLPLNHIDNLLPLYILPINHLYLINAIIVFNFFKQMFFGLSLYKNRYLTIIFN